MTPAAEAVHQMRVAVRRARSAISIFRPAVEAGALNTINDRFGRWGGSWTEPGLGCVCG